MAHFLEFVGRVDQRLGRDAADVEASAAQRLAFDQNRRDAELPGADRCHITAGAAADHEQRSRYIFHALLHEQGGRALEIATYHLHEFRGVHTVHYAMVERGR